MSAKSVKSIAIFCISLATFLALFNFTFSRSSTSILTTSPQVSRNLATPQVCMITRTFEAQYSYLYTHLFSIASNPKSRPFVFIVVTVESSPQEPVARIAKEVNALAGYQMVHLLPITPFNASSGYQGDYGYNYSDKAIDYLVEHKTQYPCDALMFSNGDNLYVNAFIDDYILPDIVEGIELIGFSYLTHYKTHPLQLNGIYHDDSTKMKFDAEFVMGHIDLSAFAVKMDLVNADSEMRFVKSHIALKYEIVAADCTMILYIASKTEKKRIHRQTLMIHQ